MEGVSIRVGCLQYLQELARCYVAVLRFLADVIMLLWSAVGEATLLAAYVCRVDRYLFCEKT